MSESQHPARVLVHRRQFLAASTAAAIGLAATDLPAAAPSAPAPFAVAVGLIDERTQRVSGLRNTASSSRAAEARVVLEGVWLRDRDAAASMDLRVYYPTADAGERLPVIAATYMSRRNGQCHATSSPCTVPLVGDGLHLGIEYDKFSSRISMAKPGRYVIALLPKAEEARWSALQFDAGKLGRGGVGPLSSRTLFGDAVPPFDYMIVRVQMT